MRALNDSDGTHNLSYSQDRHEIHGNHHLIPDTSGDKDKSLYHIMLE